MSEGQDDGYGHEIVKNLRITDAPEEKARTMKRSNAFIWMESICSRLKGLSEHQENLKEANTSYSLAKVLTCLHKEKPTRKHLVRK